MEYRRLSKIDLSSRVGDRVGLEFMARNVKVGVQKDKITRFIVFDMVDKDISSQARLFGATDEDIKSLVEGGVYRAAVDIKVWDKSSTGYSCILYNYEPSNTPAQHFADWADGLEESRKAIEDMLAECMPTVYGQIAYHIIIKYWQRFAIWTAATSMHHNQLGGLLTHTAEVIELADQISTYFNNKYSDNFINKPLLLCSCALHDIGKTLELEVDPLSGKTEYGVHSMLSTHIMDILSEVEIQAYEIGIGQREVEDENGNIQVKSDEDVEDEIEALLLLKHCLAAHHGKLEFGSPITPSIPEAIILNMMDNLSAEMFKQHKVIKSLSPGEGNTKWVGGAPVSYYKDTTKIDELATEIGGDIHE